MMPGSSFMNVLAGSLYGTTVAVPLVAFLSTTGSSGSYWLSRLVVKVRPRGRCPGFLPRHGKSSDGELGEEQKCQNAAKTHQSGAAASPSDTYAEFTGTKLRRAGPSPIISFTVCTKARIGPCTHTPPHDLLQGVHV
jgi:hypothetical protein